jgi:hypothetical protein
MQYFLTLVSSLKKKIQIASFFYFRHIFISFIKQFSIGKDCISVFVTIFFFWLKEAFFLGPNQSLYLYRPIVLQVITYEIDELFLYLNHNVTLWPKCHWPKCHQPKWHWPNCLSGQTVSGQTVSGQCVSGQKVTLAKVSFWPNCLGQSVSGQSVILAKV